MPADRTIETRTREGGIYQIRNQTNGNRYIGSGVNLKRRWQQHLAGLRHGHHHNPHLQKAWRKYGELAFVFEPLEHATPETLIEREQYYLNTCQPEYNIALTAGSPMLGRHHTLGACRKISEATKGKGNPFYGKRHSEEACYKIGAANRGNHHNKETREQMSEAWTPERRQAKSEAQKGKHRSLETRRKISLARMGKPHLHRGHLISNETRAKISQALKGRQFSAETHAKMSNAQKARQHRVRLAKSQEA